MRRSIVFGCVSCLPMVRLGASLFGVLMLTASCSSSSGGSNGTGPCQGASCSVYGPDGGGPADARAGGRDSGDAGASGGCTYTATGAQTASGTCALEQAAYDGSQVGLSLAGPLPNGAGTWTFAAVLSTSSTTLQATMYTTSNTVSSVTSYVLTNPAELWKECWDTTGMSCFDNNGMTVDTGSFTLNVTQTGPVETIGGQSLWALAHGTLAATLPAMPDPNNPQLPQPMGTIDLNVTF